MDFTFCEHVYNCVEDVIFDLDHLITTYTTSNIYIDHRTFICKSETILSFKIKLVV